MDYLPKSNRWVDGKSMIDKEYHANEKDVKGSICPDKEDRVYIIIA